MNIVEEHVSPDGFLRLLVVRGEDGDMTIGFDGYACHTHGDIEAAVRKLPEAEAVRQFVDEIIGDHRVIVVSRVGGKVCDVWWTDNPKGEFKYKPPEETLEFRRWSGAKVTVEPG